METNTIEIWMLSAIAAAAISLAIALVIWLSGKKDTTANITDRYKYPKKDCECDCLGECKDKKDDGIIKIELENKIPNPQTLNAKNKRIHHSMSWVNAVPCIIEEKYKK